MKIITIPHPTLRTVSTPVAHVDKKLKDFVVELKDTLAQKKNPKGVGLAAPQVDTKWRIFATQLSPSGSAEDDTGAQLKIYINPEIVEHSADQVFGPTKNDTTLEGCLSIPGIYGPVPRWKKIVLRYDEVVDDRLQERTAEFSEFAARVVQHEYDHLNGVLFIDYSAEYDLPLYQEDPRTEKLVEINDEMIAALLEKSRGNR